MGVWPYVGVGGWGMAGTNYNGPIIISAVVMASEYTPQNFALANPLANR